jgi:hypothetical protein
MSARLAEDHGFVRGVCTALSSEYGCIGHGEDLPVGVIAKARRASRSSSLTMPTVNKHIAQRGSFLRQFGQNSAYDLQTSNMHCNMSGCLLTRTRSTAVEVVLGGAGSIGCREFTNLLQ